MGNESALASFWVAAVRAERATEADWQAWADGIIAQSKSVDAWLVIYQDNLEWHVQVPGIPVYPCAQKVAGALG